MPVGHAAPYVPAAIDGISYRPEAVAHHGADAREFVWPGRLVIEGTWPHLKPEDCAGVHTTQWLKDGQVLVCTGCGLDCT